jgi:hypothetical protein
MRDLFGSTNFIKFGVVETILSSSDAVTKLLNGEEEGSLESGYTLDDYLSNIDSYLYGLVMLPVEDNSKLELYIRNYILYLFIPLIEKDSLYIVKSRFVDEIFKLESDNSRIDASIREFILSDITLYLKSVFDSKEEEVQIKLKNFINSEYFLEYLNNYFDIYRNKSFVEDIYFNNENVRDILISHFDFLK